MEANAIFAPMGALALLTFLVLGLIPVRRFSAAFKRQVTRDDFKFGESVRVPGEVSIPNRNYMNLLEIPLLFYVLGLMIYVSDSVTPLMLNLAWGYVGLRTVHSLVHLTFNNVFARLIAFALSNFVLMAMWVLFFFGEQLGL